MEILINDSIPIAAWKEFLHNNIHVTPFQMPEFYSAHNDVVGRSAMALALTESGSIMSLVVITLQKESGLKSYFSRRGIIYGGPLIYNDSLRNLEFLLNQIDSYLNKKVIYAEIRNFSDYSNYIPLFQKYGWEYSPHYDIQIDLSGHDKESLMKLFAYNRRRQIEQSMKSGASVVLCNNDEQVRAVYLILKQNYHDRVKLPLPEVDFFLRYFHTKALKVFAVLHNDRIIGGAFCPVLDKKSLFTYYYCGLRDYNKKIFPTHLAILASLEYCIENNIPHFDFMGAGKPGLEYGVRKYKLEFGGKLVEYGRFVKINNPFLYKIGKIGLQMSKKFIR